MRLTPKHPPGRVNRKARAYEAEIIRLRSEGYTCEAIRAALAEIGVSVSLSTVQREAARYSKGRSLVVAKASSLVSNAALPATSAAPTHPASSPAGDPRTGKEIAAAFVNGRYNNPLLRDRSKHESSRH